MSKTIGQFAIRFIQRTKDQAVKGDPTALKSLKDSTSSSKCSKLSVVENQKVTSDEESLRTVMFLSCWAPT